MSISSAMTALQADVIAARTAITTKGGTVTPNGGSSQLATDIATIPEGGGGSFECYEGDVTLVEPNGDLRIDHNLSGNKFLVLAEYDGEIVPPAQNYYIISYAYADFVRGVSGRDACILGLRIKPDGEYDNTSSYNSGYVAKRTGYIILSTNNAALNKFCPGKWHCIVFDISKLWD